MSARETATPVIGAIFALVSAFKDGGTIVQKIRDRRYRNGAQLPNERLHKALEQAVQQIEQLRDEGYGEFGAAFARDAATASKLKDITIALQDSIIKQLAAAHADDSMNDFTPAISAVTKARRETVHTLNELCMALQDAYDQPAELHSPGSLLSPVLPLISEATTPGERPTFMASPTLTDRSPTLGYSWSSPLGATRLQDTTTEMALQSSSQRQSGTLGSHESHTTPRKDLAALSPISLYHRSPSNIMPSPPISQISRASANELPSESLQDAQTPRKTVAITEKNKFAGFCKGAWHAQNLRLSKAVEPSIKEYERLYHCKKCKFRLRADSSRRGDPCFDDRMCVSGSIYFRPLFLLKSHIGCKDSKQRYQCLLCALVGDASGPYDNEKQLFEHIAHHKGALFDGARIAGPIEIANDRVMGCSMLDFDLYIPRDRAASGMSFMLPESAVELDQAHHNHSFVAELE